MTPLRWIGTLVMYATIAIVLYILLRTTPHPNPPGPFCSPYPNYPQSCPAPTLTALALPQR